MAAVRAQGWDTGCGNSSTSGRICSQEGWTAAGTAKQSAGAWRKTMLAFAKQLPGTATPASCLCVKEEARAPTPEKSGQIINYQGLYWINLSLFVEIW